MDLVREHVSENGRLNVLANKQENWPIKRPVVVNLGGWVLRYRMRLGKVLCGIAEVEFCE